MTKVQSEAGKASRAMDGMERSAKHVGVALSGIRSAAAGLGGIFATMGAGLVVKSMFSLAAGAEQTQIAFEILTGSANTAKTLVQGLRDLDKISALGFADLQSGTQQLLNYGVAANDVVGFMSRLSDIAAGDAMKLDSLARAFGQVRSAGRLTGQEKNQFINAGFNPLFQMAQDLAKLKGGTAEDYMPGLVKAMEAGQISFQDVARAIESATSAGGRFYGMNQRMSESAVGQFNRMKSEVSLLAIEIGTELLPVANDLVTWARKWVESFQGTGERLKTLVADARAWWQSIRDNVEDMGVVVGVVVGRMGNAWQDMFESAKQWAQAFYEYVTQNAGIAYENMMRGARNWQKILTGQDKEKRILTDEWGRQHEVELSNLEPRLEQKDFVAPKGGPGRNQGTLWDAIQAELETARKQRIENRKAGKMEGSKPKDELVNDRVRDMLGTRKQSEGRSETFSAESLFAHMRKGSLDRQTQLAQQSIGIQQQQLAAQQAMAANIGNIQAGLALA